MGGEFPSGQSYESSGALSLSTITHTARSLIRSLSSAQRLYPPAETAQGAGENDPEGRSDPRVSSLIRASIVYSIEEDGADRRKKKENITPCNTN